MSDLDKSRVAEVKAGLRVDVVETKLMSVMTKQCGEAMRQKETSSP